MVTSESAAAGARPRGDRERLMTIAAWVLAFAPAAWLVSEAVRTAASGYSVVPFWDHWATVADYVRAKRDGLSWDILFAQSNEHRILFGRLVMFADLEYLGGRNILPYAGIVASQLALVALFATIAMRLTGNRRAAVATLGVIAALTFSLGQWENLVWAFQVTFMMVTAAGAWSIYLYCLAFAEREKVNRVAWAGSLALLFVAAFSMANGMVAGAACVGAGLLARFRWWGLAGQAFAVAAIAALYFQDYAPSSSAGIGGALADPVTFLRFVASYVGNPARAFGEGPPVWLGAVGLAAAAAAALRVLLGRDRDAGRIALTGIMAFVIASAMTTAVGRLDYGAAQGLVSRYLTLGMLFWSAQLLYWGSLARVRGPVALLAWAAGLAILLYPVGILHTQSKAEVGARAAQVRLGVLALRAGADDPDALGGLNFNVPAMMQQVAFLKANGLSIFSERPKHPVGAAFDPSIAVRAGGCLGAFDVIAQSPKGAGWRASGWAWDVRGGRVVKDVILVDSAGRVAAVGAGGGYRPDVRPVVPQVGSAFSGWNASLAGPPAFPVSAYGLLAGRARCELGQHAGPPPAS